MQREAEKFDTSMAAVVKLNEETVRRLCSKYPDVYPVNFNCPGQITVSGLSEHMADFSADVKSAGGRAIPLKVRGAFHSPFMKEAARDFKAALAESSIGTPGVPLYSNMSARPYTDDIVELLSGQICSPVRWEDSVRAMIDDGVDTFIEIGPGKTLTNLIKKIDANVTAMTVFEYLSEVEKC